MAVTSSVYSEEQTRSMGIDEEERSLADGNRCGGIDNDRSTSTRDHLISRILDFHQG